MPVWHSFAAESTVNKLMNLEEKNKTLLLTSFSQPPSSNVFNNGTMLYLRLKYAQLIILINVNPMVYYSQNIQLFFLHITTTHPQQRFQVAYCKCIILQAIFKKKSSREQVYQFI